MSRECCPDTCLSADRAIGSIEYCLLIIEYLFRKPGAGRPIVMQLFSVSQLIA